MAPPLQPKPQVRCDFDKRAIIHPLTVNYAGLDKNFKNPFGAINFGPSSSYIFIPSVFNIVGGNSRYCLQNP